MAALNGRASDPLAPAESESTGADRDKPAEIRLAAPGGGGGTRDPARLSTQTEQYRLLLFGQGSEPLPCPLTNWFLTGLSKPLYYLNFPKPSEEKCNACCTAKGNYHI